MKEKVFWKFSDILFDKINSLKNSMKNLGLTIKTCSSCGKKFISRRYWEVCPSCYSVFIKP